MDNLIHKSNQKQIQPNRLWFMGDSHDLVGAGGSRGKLQSTHCESLIIQRHAQLTPARPPRRDVVASDQCNVQVGIIAVGGIVAFPDGGTAVLSAEQPVSRPVVLTAHMTCADTISCRWTDPNRAQHRTMCAPVLYPGGSERIQFCRHGTLAGAVGQSPRSGKL